MRTHARRARAFGFYYQLETQIEFVICVLHIKYGKTQKKSTLLSVEIESKHKHKGCGSRKTFALQKYINHWGKCQTLTRQHSILSPRRGELDNAVEPTAIKSKEAAKSDNF